MKWFKNLFKKKTEAVEVAVEPLNGDEAYPDDPVSPDVYKEWHDRIALMAWHKWNAAGQPEGMSDYFWHEAENEMVLSSLPIIQEAIGEAIANFSGISRADFE